MSKKITVEDLINNKIENKDRTGEKIEINVPSIGGSIIATIPSIEDCIDSLTQEKGEQETYLLYQCIVQPSMKSDKLKKAYGCKKDSFDIVDKIFDYATKQQIAALLLKECGFTPKEKVKLVDDIKN